MAIGPQGLIGSGPSPCADADADAGRLVCGCFFLLAGRLFGFDAMLALMLVLVLLGAVWRMCWGCVGRVGERGKSGRASGREGRTLEIRVVGARGRGGGEFWSWYLAGRSQPRKAFSQWATRALDKKRHARGTQHVERNTQYAICT